MKFEFKLKSRVIGPKYFNLHKIKIGVKFEKEIKARENRFF